MVSKKMKVLISVLVVVLLLTAGSTAMVMTQEEEEPMLGVRRGQHLGLKIGQHHNQWPGKSATACLLKCLQMLV